MEFFNKGGGSGWVDFPLRKKNKKTKCKDDQNGPFHPEKSRLNFFIIGWVRSNFRADSPILFLFYFISMVISFKI